MHFLHHQYSLEYLISRYVWQASVPRNTFSKRCQNQLNQKKKKRSRKPRKPQDVQIINVGTSSESKGASSLPREPSTGKACILRVLFCEEATHIIDKIVPMEDVYTEVATLSKEDVKTTNVDTSSKSEGKGKERASSLPREPSSGKACVLRVLFVKKQLMLSTK